LGYAGQEILGSEIPLRSLRQRYPEQRASLSRNAKVF
jgi:hypothetical protein